MKRPIAYHAAATVVEVEHGRETEIKPVCRKLGRDHQARRPRRGAGPTAVTVPHLAQPAHRRQRAESGAETLYPPAFVIDAKQNVRTKGAHFSHESTQLAGALVIAREQNRAANGAVAQAGPVIIAECRADDVDDRRSRRLPHAPDSSITVALANSLSSDNDRWQRPTPRSSRSAASAGVNSSLG